MSRTHAEARYTTFAIALHWIMAAGILILGAMGLVMVHSDLEPTSRFQLYQVHKSIGLTILLAAIVRIVWRIFHRPPALPADMRPFEMAAARTGHALLYVFLIALPLTGWALVSASALGIPTLFFGRFPVPHFSMLSDLADKGPAEDLLKGVHACGAWALLALAAGHALAALRHHFIHKDDVLLRMLPRRPLRSVPPIPDGRETQVDRH
jgi:cytochrome b561